VVDEMWFSGGWSGRNIHIETDDFSVGVISRFEFSSSGV
jgi:hypothetical protein